MAVVNNCNFIGRTTREIELRFIPNSGTAVANGAIAVEDAYKPKEREAMFLEFKQFGKGAETMANYVKKGKLIALSGELKIEKWEDKNGNKRLKPMLMVNSFKILEWGDSNQQNPQTYQQAQKSDSQNEFDGFQAIDESDEIPF